MQQMTQTDTLAPYFTTAEAAKYLRTTARQLRAMVRRGRITAYRLPVGAHGIYRFKKTDLDASMAGSEVAP